MAFVDLTRVEEHPIGAYVEQEMHNDIVPRPRMHNLAGDDKGISARPKTFVLIDRAVGDFSGITVGFC